MAVPCNNNLSSKLFFYDDKFESALNCCDRSRHMMKMRRSVSLSAVSEACREFEIFSSSATKLQDDKSAVPNHGIISIAGRMREMEDTVSIRINLCYPDICGGRPIHFFAVFDGHGGPEVAAICKERMHIILEEELRRVNSTGGSRKTTIFRNKESKSKSGSEAKAKAKAKQEEEEEEEKEVTSWWRWILKRTFQRMDEWCFACEENANNKALSGCQNIRLSHLHNVLGIVGSTAIVCILTPDHIIVANCGDSRAVLSRTHNRVIPVSIDHKPDRPDELKRITEAGGHIICLKGARVEGVLAMSRSLGDKYLKPIVISEPEIYISKRDPKEDECLILASDGMWDVMTNELACELTRSCLRERKCFQKNVDRINGMLEDFSSRTHPITQGAALAAALLTRLALGRGSSDNISIIVIDLKNKRK